MEVQRTLTLSQLM